MAKKLSKVAKSTLAAALVTSAIVPVASANEATAIEVKEVIFKDANGKLVKIGYESYVDGIVDGLFNFSQGIAYLVDGKGNIYNYGDYISALVDNDFNTVAAYTDLESNYTPVTDLEVTEGKFENGVVVGDPTPSPEPEPQPEVTVESVSAINNTVTVGAEYTLPTEVTATLSDGTTKELAVTWDGTIDTSVAGTQTLQGTVEGFTGKAELIVQVKYANTGIEGFAFLGDISTGENGEKPEAAEGAAIFVNGEKQTQTVQADGRFVLETNPAAVEVKIKKEGYFASKVDTGVAQNETAAVVAGLNEVTPNTLEINGTVKGATGANLAGATVELYDATGTTKLATAVTAVDGTYKFGNKGLEYNEFVDGESADDLSTSNFYNDKKQPINVLEIDTKYVVKISKPLSKDNKVDVYKEATATITTTDEQAITKVQTRIAAENKVKEIKEAKVTLKAEQGVTLGSTANVKIYTEIGTTLLSKEEVLAEGESQSLTAVSGSEDKTLNILEVLKQDGKNPTLPTGKYYVVISDGNADTVYVMNVTEGKDVTGETVTIKKAAELGIQSTVGNFVYTDSLLANGKKVGEAKLTVGESLTQINAGKVTSEEPISRLAEGEGAVTADYALYQVVDGVNIPLTTIEGEADANVYKMASETTASATTALSETVAKGNSYVVKSSSGYAITDKEIKTTIDSESTTEIVAAKSAATIKPNITFNTKANGRDADVEGEGEGVSAVYPYEAKLPKNEDVTIKLLAKDGTVVVETDLATLEEEDKTVKSAFAGMFAGVRPGEYRLEVSAPGYETKTLKADEAVRVLDFQNQVIDITLDAEAPTKLTGTILFGNGDGLVDGEGVEASVALYEVSETGALTFVTGKDLDVSGNPDAAFNFVDILEEGTKYKVIARGAGFETKVAEFTAKEGLNVLDLVVAKGGNASATITITDTKKNAFTEDPGAYVLDSEYVGFAWYDADDKAIEATVVGEAGVEVDGENVAYGESISADIDGNGTVSTSEQSAFLDLLFQDQIALSDGTALDLTYNGVYAVAQDDTDEKIFTVAGLSKGNHTLVVPSAKTASGVESYRYQNQAVKITYAGQKLVTAVTVEIPTIKDGVITYNVSGDVFKVGTNDSTDQNVLVAAYQGDTLIDYVSANEDSDTYGYVLKLPNGKYTLKAYSNGELVSVMNDVAVQNNHVKGKNFTLTK